MQRQLWFLRISFGKDERNDNNRIEWNTKINFEEGHENSCPTTIHEE